MLFVYFMFVFFFQAEDGIRVFHVTGVQTCALPIFSNSSLSSTRCTVTRPVDVIALPVTTRRYGRGPCWRPPVAALSPRACTAARSEERRVGKECRSRW